MSVSSSAKIWAARFDAFNQTPGPNQVVIINCIEEQHAQDAELGIVWLAVRISGDTAVGLPAGAPAARSITGDPLLALLTAYLES